VVGKKDGLAQDSTAAQSLSIDRAEEGSSVPTYGNPSAKRLYRGEFLKLGHPVVGLRCSEVMAMNATVIVNV